MGEQENQILRDSNWVVMEGSGDHDINADSISMESSSLNSTDSGVSSSSSELVEDASSSSTSYPSSSSSSSSNGPLYELSELMAHLPLKRGLSMFYEGKSQSFTSLASVKSLEDLAKRTPQRKKMKSCKSYGGGLDGHKLYSTSPKAIISKKASRGSSFSYSVGKKGSLLGGSRPSFPVQKNF